MPVPKAIKWVSSLLGHLGNLQLAAAIVSGAAMSVWAAISGFPAPMIVFLGLGTLAFVLMAYHAVRIIIEDWRRSSIPIAISRVAQHGTAVFALHGGPPSKGEPEDPCALNYGRVTITNISASRSVNLELLLEVRGLDGWHSIIPAGPKDRLGRRIDRHGAAIETLKKLSMDVPTYLEPPIHLRPGEAMTGNLTFLWEPFDEEMRVGFVKRALMSSERQDRLIVSDLVSGLTLELRLPATYRGKAD
jgi:hypothetical protein